MTTQKTYHAVLFTGCPNYLMKPLGAHKVAHELRQAGFDVLVINHVDSFSTEQLVNLLKRTVSDQTLFVGISATFLNYNFDDQQHIEPGQRNSHDSHFCGMLPQGHQTDKIFVRTIKRQNEKCKIVIGGGVFDVRPPSRDLVDYFVYGYADVSIVQLARYLAYDEPLKVNNWRDIHGGIIIDDGEAKTFDFNNSTMIWCDDDVMVPGEVLPLEVSRGCVFKCKFCSYRLNGKKQVDYLKHMHIIEQEMLDNYNRYGITHYRLVDDTFNDSQEKIDAMLDTVKRLPFQPRFNAYMRLDLMASKPHTIPQLYDIGFRAMFFGIETLNRRTGAIIGKGADPEKLVDTVKSLKKTYGHSLHLTGSFICGLPEESKDSVSSSMARIINREIPLDFVLWQPLMIAKQSEVIYKSSIDTHSQDYGYQILADDVGLSCKAWKNPYMTFFEARDMCVDFYKAYRCIHKASEVQQRFWPYGQKYVSGYHEHLWKFLNFQPMSTELTPTC